MGLILANLDPDLSIQKTYNNNVLDKISDGSLPILEIYNTSSEMFCPEASKGIREEIAIRTGIKIDIKPSKMFKCPNCKMRYTTY